MLSSVDSDALLALHDVLLAAGRAHDLGERLRALADGLAAVAGGPTTIAVRDDAMTETLSVRALPPDTLGDGASPGASRGAPVRAAVWRRWLRLLRARRAHLASAEAHAPIYALDLADPWSRDEFGVALCGLPTDGRDVGGPAGLLVAPLAARDGQVLATLVQEVPGPWPPPAALVRAVELVGQQAAQHVAESRLEALAKHHAERLHRLQEAGAALARTLDEGEIVRELARQVARLVQADGVVVAHPDLERDAS
jgi:hypothetical protein